MHVALKAAVLGIAGLVVLLTACVSPADRAKAAAAYASYDPGQPFAESAFVESQGFQLHYRHWLPAVMDAAGQAIAPRGQILLVHGFGASTFSFRHQVPALVAAGWEVAAADYSPFGFSSKSTDYTNFDRGSLLWAVPEVLGWHGPIVLLGHSLGGQYITAMQAERPGQVRALILLAGAVHGYTESPGAPGVFGGISPATVDSIVSNWSFVRDTLHQIARQAVPDEMVNGYIAPFQLPGGSQALLAWSAAMRRQPALHPELIRLPTLLLWGQRDSLVPLSVGKDLAKHIPGARLEILPGQGHVPHELQPQLVNPIILDFLNRLE